MTATLFPSYPSDHSARSRWILDQRPRRNRVDPTRPYSFFVEEERAASGEIVPVATVLLTNRECPWRCLMCDLWQNTLDTDTPLEAIPTQIEYALSLLPPAKQIKLYNSGSFFDPRAIPVADYGDIAHRVALFEKVIVESHPSLVSERCFHFESLLVQDLEVAMGLETAHPKILEQLNKEMTLDHFAAAAARLASHSIDLRVFILVKPPFMLEEEAVEWTARSLDFAFDCGATAATLIPTRGGNGAMENLAAAGRFAPPLLKTLEAALAYGLSANRGRVFVDLWAMRHPDACSACYVARVDRLRHANLQQMLPPMVDCRECGGAG